MSGFEYDVIMFQVICIRESYVNAKVGSCPLQGCACIRYVSSFCVRRGSSFCARLVVHFVQMKNSVVPTKLRIRELSASLAEAGRSRDRTGTSMSCKPVDFQVLGSVESPPLSLFQKPADCLCDECTVPSISWRLLELARQWPGGAPWQRTLHW